MSDPSYRTFRDDPNNPPEPDEQVGQVPFSPEELQGDEDRPLTTAEAVLVQIVNRLIRVRPAAAGRIAVGQGAIGGTGQQQPVEIVGRQPARRNITLVNIGTVQWEWSGERNLQPNNGFPLAVGASFSDMPYNGPIYGRLTTDGTAGRFAWVAVLEDG